MRLAIPLVLVIAAVTYGADRTIRFSSPMYFLPAVKSIVVTKAGEPGPDNAKHEAVASVAALKDEAKLPGEGPYDIWFIPKDGKSIKAVSNWKAKEASNEIKLNDHLGVISFR